MPRRERGPMSREAEVRIHRYRSFAVSMRHRQRDDAGDREVAELAALADGSLDPERRVALEARVAESPELAELLAEQERAVALVRAPAAEVDAPASLRARVQAQRPARRAPRRFVLVAGTAAAAAAAVVIGLSVFDSGTSAEQFHAALAPTDLVPAASGQATLTKTTSGWQIELDAAGLPRLDDGRFYAAWLRNDAGVLVPIGTFNEGEDVVLWAGVSPEEFSTLTVTRERADNEQASSGERVLVGSVETG
jgi:Anti-sigma-K factor rskA